METRDQIQEAIEIDIKYLEKLKRRRGTNHQQIQNRLDDLMQLKENKTQLISYHSVKDNKQFGTATTKQNVALLRDQICHVEKIRRAPPPALTASRFTLFNAAHQPVLAFSVEQRSNHHHNLSLCGNSGKIKRCHDTTKNHLHYALKKYNQSISLTNSEVLIIANRSAFFAKLLHWKTAYSFQYHGKRRDKICLIMDWIDGMDLFDLSQSDKLNCVPFELRLKGMLDIVSQIASLHAVNLIFQDIKPENIMWTHNMAILIDTESIIHESERGRRDAIYSNKYISRDLLEQLMQGLNHTNILSGFFSKQTDLYSLGLTIGFLLPELFNVLEKAYHSVTLYELEVQHTYLAQHGELIRLITRLLDTSTYGGYVDASEAFETLHRHITQYYGISYPYKTALALNEIEILEQLAKLENPDYCHPSASQVIAEKIALESDITEDLFQAQQRRSNFARCK